MEPPPLGDDGPAADDRDVTAAGRDRTSESLDRVSGERDDLSEARDQRAEAREAQAVRFDPEAASDRAGAKRDRQGGAADRKHARDDRGAAATDRRLSARERAELVVDGLTGALRREPGLVELERELLQARRTRQPFVLAFVDVDGLKATNDLRGHQAGDELLQQIASTLRGTIREYDLMVRYGGDEFLCGFSNLSLADAERRFEITEASPASAVRPPFSVGFAELAGDDTVAELVGRADAAMYQDRLRQRAATGRAVPPKPRPAPSSDDLDAPTSP